MNLLETFDRLIGSWRDVFPQKRTFERARRLVFGLVVSVRMHLTSNAICATGRQFVDWTADYRVCSRSPRPIPTPAGSGKVERRPALLRLPVDVRAVIEQPLHHQQCTVARHLM